MSYLAKPYSQLTPSVFIYRDSQVFQVILWYHICLIDVSVRRNLKLKEKMIDKLKLNQSEELNREISAKMQRMLEETLARNVQLQKVWV